MPLKRPKATPAQCKAMTGSGQRCKAKPHKNGLCFFHFDPQRAAELGRKGGRRRAAFNPDGLKEIEAPKTVADLRDLLAQSIVEIRSGKLDPKLANSGDRRRCPHHSINSHSLCSHCVQASLSGVLLFLRAFVIFSTFPVS